MSYDLILSSTAATWVVNLILLALGFVLLVKGADFFVDGRACRRLSGAVQQRP